MKKLVLSALVTMLLSNVWVVAQQSTFTPVPRVVKYSGVIPRATGTVGITFALYNEQVGGAPIWVETQNVTLDQQGRYAVLLGAKSEEGLPISAFVSGEARWLGIEPQGQPELPRVLFASVPYAMKAADADTLGGRPLSAFVLVQPGVSASPTKAAGDPVISPDAISGTNGRIAKFLSDGVSLGDSQITETATSIGMFTTTPTTAFKLDVAGAAQFKANSSFGDTALRLLDKNGWSRFLVMTMPAMARFHADNNADLSLGGWSGQNNQYNDNLYINNTTRNVGIGTTSPAQKLSVVGVIESTTGGFKFPDGSVQVTAASGGSGGSYTAGAGLTLSGSQFSVNFAGTGSATTATRSDHNHDANYLRTSGGTMTGAISFASTQTFDGAKLADASVTTSKLVDGSVSNPKIASLDAAKITSGTLDGARLPSSVPLKLSDGSLTVLGSFGFAAINGANLSLGDTEPRYGLVGQASGTAGVGVLGRARTAGGFTFEGQQEDTTTFRVAGNGNITASGLLNTGKPEDREVPDTSGDGEQYAGVMVTKINSTDPTAGYLVAASAGMRLERDGTNGGWRIRTTSFASGHPRTLACQAFDSAGNPYNKFLQHLGPGTTATVFTNEQGIVYMRCLFGFVYFPGHVTEVSLIRQAGDYYWGGFMTSTKNH